MARRILHLRRVGKPAPGDHGVPSLLEFCRRSSPAWELTRDGALLDLSGTERLYGPGIDGAEFLCRRARRRDPAGEMVGGTAPAILAARLASGLAARFGSGVFAVGTGSLGAFLARFSVEFLPSRPDEISRLNQLGVRTFGDLQVVPRPLLRAVFGDRGAELADLASGRCGRTLRGTDGTNRESVSGLEIVVGVRLDRPLAARAGLVALRRGLALRALSLRPAGQVRGPSWKLTVFRAEGGLDTAWARGPARTGWSAWTRWLDRIWDGLPRRRAGLVGAELHAGRPLVGGPRQGSLFPEDDRDRRLALALAGIHRTGPGAVAVAGEDLLSAWGVQWYGPGEDISRKGRGLVDDGHPGR